MTIKRDAMCSIVRASILTVESIEELPSRFVDHAGTCLRCQAQAARNGSNRRMLSGLVGLTYSAPPSLNRDIMRSLDAPAQRRSPLAGVVAAGVATGCVAAVVVWRRYRSLPATR